MGRQGRQGGYVRFPSGSGVKDVYVVMFPPPRMTMGRFIILVVNVLRWVYQGIPPGKHMVDYTDS